MWLTIESCNIVLRLSLFYKNSYLLTKYHTNLEFWWGAWIWLNSLENSFVMSKVCDVICSFCLIGWNIPCDYNLTFTSQCRCSFPFIPETIKDTIIKILTLLNMSRWQLVEGGFHDFSIPLYSCDTYMVLHIYHACKSHDHDHQWADLFISWLP